MAAKRVAVVRDGVVDNVIVADDMSVFTSPEWRAELAGAVVVTVKHNQTAAPGWTYDAGRSPEFQEPDQPGDADDIS